MIPSHVGMASDKQKFRSKNRQGAGRVPRYATPRDSKLELIIGLQWADKPANMVERSKREIRVADAGFKSIKLEREEGVTFVILNRPDKRNAMSPELHREMCEALDELETEDETKIVVVTGAGESFSAGQDIKLYFRGTEDNPKGRAQAR